MSYDSTEITEYSAKATFFYVISLGGTITYYWTNAPKTLTATLDSVSTQFTHPRGGISHTEPTEGGDAPGTGVEIKVSPNNAVIRKHKSFPTPGTATVTIYRQNELSGELRQVWFGYIVETPINEEFEGDTLIRTGILICETDQEQISGQEGLIDNFGPLCPWMLGTAPCPVPLASVTDTATVVSVTPADFQVRVTPTDSREAGWYKPGVLMSSDEDKRHIVDDTVTGADHILTLNQNFPSTTVKAGDTVQLIWGDDRLRGTCATKFGQWTGDGAAWGGNNIQTNKNIHQIGRLQ